MPMATLQLLESSLAQWKISLFFLVTSDLINHIFDCDAEKTKLRNSRSFKFLSYKIIKSNEIIVRLIFQDKNSKKGKGEAHQIIELHAVTYIY